MPKDMLIQVSPEIAANDVLLNAHVAKLIPVTVSDIRHVSILKRSIDARQKAIKVNLKIQIFFDEDEIPESGTT
ncbi:MAG TPA: FAD-binding protein, partial [Flavobacterium sp.]|nr:FAD-binding protein [Flavobacterium sp.]